MSLKEAEFLLIMKNGKFTVDVSIFSTIVNPKVIWIAELGVNIVPLVCQNP